MQGWVAPSSTFAKLLAQGEDKTTSNSHNSAMRMTQLLGQTRKEIPSSIQSRSHELLIRGAYIHQNAAGIFTLMPLGFRVAQKIQQILREEMNLIGGQELSMPVVHPAELWQETGRWYKVGAELSRFQDRKDHDMVLAMTHEETTGDLVRQFVHSYRDLPRMLYHIQTKWRDDARPRAGLIRVREFTMKDSYSLDHSWGGLEQQYIAHFHSYFRIYQRCLLPALAVLSDTGMMGGSIAHEFMYPCDVGEDTLLLCDSCNYSANRQVAAFAKPEAHKAEALPLEEVATPDCSSIEGLSKFLGIQPQDCLKMVFFVAEFPRENGDGKPEQKLVAAALRGDMNLNETKLSGLIKASNLRPAIAEEIQAAGASAGYASPIGLQNCIVVADELALHSSNLVGGANKAGFHLKNINYPRDYSADFQGDICAAEEGSACPKCQKPMRSTKAVEVGNIFQLGTFYSEKMGCYYTDEDGNSKPVIMGSYGIGVDRLLSCIAEEHNDADGLKWPISVAPFQVSLVALADKKDPSALQKAEELYHKLSRAGIEVLFDDRDERPGFKFKDADLLGIPMRITIGSKSLANGGVEFLQRGKGKEEAEIWPLEEVLERCQAYIAKLHDEIRQQMHEVPYNA